MENKPKPEYPNFLIVSGNGRNSGKTGFISRLIRSVSPKQAITAVKISPHFHPDRDKKDVIIKKKNFTICTENDPDGRKDSSRMLQAGAKSVYYIEVLDEHLPQAFGELLKLPGMDRPVIFESGGLRELLVPSLYILINRRDGRKDKDSFIRKLPLADKLIFFEETSFSYPPENILFTGTRWKTQ